MLSTFLFALSFWPTSKICHFTIVLPALISYIRPVFVFRSDQHSRRKTVEEIKRRARSEGEWPQVTYMRMHMNLYYTHTQRNRDLNCAHTAREWKVDSRNTMSHTQLTQSKANLKPWGTVLCICDCKYSLMIVCFLQIMIFPEGTCTNRSGLILFKAGMWTAPFLP